MQDKLKPCPFCGSDEFLQVRHCEGTVIHPAYKVKCDNCGASTGYSDRGDHVKEWNKRNSEDVMKQYFDSIPILINFIKSCKSGDVLNIQERAIEVLNKWDKSRFL